MCAFFTFTYAPFEGHYRRAIHVILYLFSSACVGCLFLSTELEFATFTDSALALRRSHGLSSTDNLFCLGCYAVLLLLLRLISSESERVFMTRLIGEQNMLKVLLDNHATLHVFKNEVLVSNIRAGRKTSFGGIGGSKSGMSTIQVCDIAYVGVVV